MAIATKEDVKNLLSFLSTYSGLSKTVQQECRQAYGLISGIPVSVSPTSPMAKHWQYRVEEIQGTLEAVPSWANDKVAKGEKIEVVTVHVKDIPSRYSGKYTPGAIRILYKEYLT